MINKIYKYQWLHPQRHLRALEVEGDKVTPKPSFSILASKGNTFFGYWGGYFFLGECWYLPPKQLQTFKGPMRSQIVKKNHIFNGYENPSVQTYLQMHRLTSCSLLSYKDILKTKQKYKIARAFTTVKSKRRAVWGCTRVTTHLLKIKNRKACLFLFYTSECTFPPTW